MLKVIRTSMLNAKLVRFFFFKQKTAYEMELRLEFRRVLFRSRTERRLGRPGSRDGDGSRPCRWGDDHGRDSVEHRRGDCHWAHPLCKPEAAGRQLGEQQHRNRHQRDGPGATAPTRSAGVLPPPSARPPPPPPRTPPV